MPSTVHPISVCLWFDDQAEVEFELDGQPFVALNGGPLLKRRSR